MKKMNKKGFTIVELVIVIAVIGILAAVLIPTFSSVIDKANASKALQEARNKYTVAYADDLSDGTLDKKIGNTDITDSNYTVSNGVATYSYNDGKYTATYDGTNWTVGKNS